MIKQLRFLQVYAVISTVFTGCAMWLALDARRAKGRVDVLDVGRINIVEPDGRKRIVITSAAQFQPDHRPRQAGMLFFNTDGVENGGLTIEGTKKDGKVDQVVHFSMDRYDQDQTVVLQHHEVDGGYWSGLRVHDRPASSLSALLPRVHQILAMPEGPAKNAAVAAFLKESGPAPVRVVVGRDRDESALVRLADGQGRTRIRMRVTIDGRAALEFLDDKGVVVASYPPAAAPADPATRP